MTFLLDSNALIYAARPETLYAPFKTWAQHSEAVLSAISRVEVLGFTRLTSADALVFQAIFQLLPQLPVTDAILDRAIVIRQQFRIKTPDAIIAATALEHGLQLVTADQGFAPIAGLVVIDPLAT